MNEIPHRAALGTFGDQAAEGEVMRNRPREPDAVVANNVTFADVKAKPSRYSTTLVGSDQIVGPQNRRSSE
jgi:hypothetical protein